MTEETTQNIKNMSPETIELWAGRLTAWAAFSGAFAGIATIGALIFSNWDGENKKAALERFKEGAKKEIEDVKKQTALANESARVLEKDAAQLRNSAEEARLQTERLKLMTQWRTISPEKFEVLSKELATRPGSVVIGYIGGDSEVMQLAMTIGDAFHTWKVEYSRREYLNLIAGVRVSGTDSDKVEFVKAAFTKAGIEFSAEPIKSPMVRNPISHGSVGPVSGEFVEVVICFKVVKGHFGDSK